MKSGQAMGLIRPQHKKSTAEDWSVTMLKFSVKGDEFILVPDLKNAAEDIRALS
jgi:hypothetical protein